MSQKSRTSLFSRLAALNEAEIESLIEMLEGNERERQMFVDFLRGLRVHRSNSATPKLHSDLREDAYQSPVEPAPQNSMTLVSDMRKLFYEFFMDQELFPTTKDVIKAVNQIANSHYRVEVYQKIGRYNFLNKVWEFIERAPNSRKEKIIWALMDAMRSRHPADPGYQHLFKLLTRNEQNR